MKKQEPNLIVIMLLFSMFLASFAFVLPLNKTEKNSNSPNLKIVESIGFQNELSNLHNTIYGANYLSFTQQVVTNQENTESLALYNTGESDIEKELNDNAKEQLDNLDFEEIENLLESLDASTRELFENISVKEKIQKILSGDFKLLGDNALSAVLNLFFNSIASLVPLMASIIAIGVLSGMLNQVRGNQGNKNLGDIIHFVCYGLILVLITGSVYKLLKITSSALGNIKILIDGVFPILLTLLTAVGGTVSATVYQPAIALLSGSIMQVFNSILVPIFIFSFAFSIISNFSTGFKLNKFSEFLNSLFKWIIGTVFTVFMAFISIQGLTAGSFDGVSVKTAKYAVKNSIPFLGSYLADGFNVIIASSVLIKNAIGLSGLIILVLNVITPIISIAVFSLFCKLTASILEPITDGRVSNFLFGVSKSVSMLSAILIGVSFMFLILTGLVMFSANFI